MSDNQSHDQSGFILDEFLLVSTVYTSIHLNRIQRENKIIELDIENVCSDISQQVF